ncbi:MAG: response regulator [Bacteroidota bacterium]|nr:response regulator [Bacteroidota bacterium]
MMVTYVIDDDKLYQFAMKRMLHHLSIETEIVQFENGLQAIEYLQQHKDKKNQLPDIIFLDINMPVMNGWQFLDAFMNLHLNPQKKITIYMVTSSVDNAEILKAASYKQIRNYIIKPLSIASLREVFKNIPTE